MARGDHIKVRRGLYTHHGVDLGGGRVAHYSGLADGLRGGPVEIVGRQRFARNRAVHIVHHDRRLDPDQIVERALERLGEDRYHLVIRNCEHFATWAVTGRAQSSQVRTVTAASTVALVLVAVMAKRPLVRRAVSA